MFFDATQTKVYLRMELVLAQPVLIILEIYLATLNSFPNTFRKNDCEIERAVLHTMNPDIEKRVTTF